MVGSKGETLHSKRLIVAIIALPLLYLYVTALQPVFFLCLLMLVAVLAQAEFNNMYRLNPTLSILSIIIGLLLIGLPFYFRDSQSHPLIFIGINMLVLIMGFMILSTYRLFSKSPEGSLSDLAPAVVGIAYIPTLLLPQWYLRLMGSEWIILLYGCVWASDSLAYYVGKGIGRHKLYYAVSPNKTIEGAIGSVVGGTVASMLIAWLIGLYNSQNHLGDMTVLKIALLGLLIGSITIIGDLVESMFKRDANIKDSGSILPGHGGLLDKLDGALFAGPAMYIYLLLVT